MEMGFIVREGDLVPKIEHYFARKGWNVLTEAKVRGKTVDVLAVKADKITAVEVKVNAGGIQRGIEYALHQKNAVDLSYLALPSDLASHKVKETCRNLGVGLLIVDDSGIQEVVEPTQGKSMPSVRKLILEGLGRRMKNEDRVVRTTSSLERLFRSNAQILVLKLLLLNSTSEFHLHDVARKTGLAPSTVAKEIKILSGLSLVKRRSQGNLTLLAINTESPIYEELKRIFMKYEMLDEVIKQELPSGIEYALIYGSCAKGKEEARSDIDLLAVGKVDEDKLLRSISEVEHKIGREINYNLWSKEEFRDKAKNKIPLLTEILKTPVIMIVGDESEFKRIIRQGTR
jgi:predicted nucleotidyltransferase